jgi:TonB dependent receptor-like, beta-barrel/Carboxypeptidase regulatory-like domain
VSVLKGRLAGFVLVASVCAPAAYAEQGGVLGWVEDAKGVPVAGAVVSLFGKGLSGGGLVTLSDASGRFYVPSLPAGSYTLRALGGPRSAATRRITVLPNRDSIFTLSFASATRADPEAAREQGTPEERELRWFLRHKRRSVLEDRSPEQAVVASQTLAATNLLESLVPWLPGLGANLELAASPALFSPGVDGLPSDLPVPSLGALHLKGRVSNLGRWSVGGLVADTESTTWRTAAEFVLEPSRGHQISVGAGYGTRYLQPAVGVASADGVDNRTVGAVFVHDRLSLGDRLTAGAGARFTYVGFVRDRTLLSPTASLEYKVGARTRLRASASSQTVTPGGDLLTLSTLQTTPAMSIALVGNDMRAERLMRYELAAERSAGAASLGAFVFREGTRDRLLNVVDQTDSRTLRITNEPGAVVQGVGISVGRRFGDGVRGSLTYTYGRVSASQEFPGLSSGRAAMLPGGSDGRVQDLVGRIETYVDASGTRVVAYCRVNAWSPDAPQRGHGGALVNTRFDVQLTQDLPFLRSMTRSDWELLVAFRNLFYETSEGGDLCHLTC